MPTTSNQIYQLYLELHQKHGSPERLWPQWCASKKTPKLKELIAIGAILTQRTSWHNADLALRNLKKAKLLSIEKIADLSNLNCLRQLIRPAGFYTTKPQRVFNLCFFITSKYENLENFMGENLKKAASSSCNFHKNRSPCVEPINYSGSASAGRTIM